MLRRHLMAGLLILASAGGATAQAADVTVFAAASLKNALDAAVARWHQQSGKEAAVSYAASSTLAKQIANGAPADLFISADLEWMDYLQKRNQIKPKTRVDLVGNSLVLVAPKDSPVTVTIAPGFPLKSLLHGGRLAMAEPRSVPAGIYGKAALEKLGVWNNVGNDIAAAQNVRAALALVARGEAPLGIVYKTDATAEPSVRILATFPADSHPPIVYPMALTVRARPAAAKLEAFLQSPDARRQFEQQGFTLPDGEK
jgi:molybdate transport system substrate-binding protein